MIRSDIPVSRSDTRRSPANLMALLVVVAVTLMPCVWLSAQTQEDVATAVEKAKRQQLAARLLEETKIARDENAARLRTAFGSGHLTQTVYDGRSADALTILDSDIQFFYDAPKFRVHLLHATRLMEAVQQADQTPEDFEKWIPSPITEQMIIFDGNKLVALEFEGQACRGEIFFGFSKMAVMRSAGFPFESPVDLWSEALKIERLDLADLSVTPLDDGGFVGIMSKSSYRQKFFFLEKFGYDLRRVSSYSNAETKPFRDYLMFWDESNGVYYVKRFANTVTSNRGDGRFATQTSRRLSVEFQSFDANVEISPSVFTLGSLNIPEGTVFHDRRASVEGGSQKLRWTNAELQPLVK